MSGVEIWHQIGPRLQAAMIRYSCDADLRTVLRRVASRDLTVAQALETMETAK